MLHRPCPARPPLASSPALRSIALAALAAGLFACGGKDESGPEGSPGAGGEQTGGDDEPGTGATAPSGGDGGEGAVGTGGTSGFATGGEAGDGAGGSMGGGAESGGGATPSGGSAGTPPGGNGTGGDDTGGAATGGSGLGGIATGGTATGGNAAGGEGTGGVFDPGDDPSVSTQLDLLLVIDNSLSMAEKQALFAEAIPAVVLRLVNPPCVDAEGLTVAEPSTPDEACPDGSAREILPVDDLHVGVVSSSLGGHGGYICSPAEGSLYVPEKDDRGELIGPLRGVTTYQDQGFLKWDPRGLGTPPGQSDPAAFAAEVAALVAAAGDTGCGYEAPLESWYRFLVDPEPPLEVRFESNQSVRTGINTTLLEQRAAFLRPSSALAIVMLGDENDCSVIDFGPGFVVGASTRAPSSPAARSPAPWIRTTPAAAPARSRRPHRPRAAPRWRTIPSASSAPSATPRIQGTSAASTRSGATESICSTQRSATSRPHQPHHRARQRRRRDRKPALCRGARPVAGDRGRSSACPGSSLPRRAPRASR
jgi:hypothetical protein